MRALPKPARSMAACWASTMDASSPACEILSTHPRPPDSTRWKLSSYSPSSRFACPSTPKSFFASSTARSSVMTSRSLVASACPASIGMTKYRQLVASECLHRIDAARPTRGHVAGQRAHREKHRGHPAECDRVERLHLEEQAAEVLRRHVGCRDSDH